jgi:Response regulator receiver domain
MLSPPLYYCSHRYVTKYHLKPMEILRPAVTEYLRNIQKIGLPPGVFGGDLSTNMPHAETLVVDDLDEFRNFLCTALQEKTQCKVVDEASDGLQAVQQAEKLQPELILLDVGLPSMNGLQASPHSRTFTKFQNIVRKSECLSRNSTTCDPIGGVRLSPEVRYIRPCACC